MPAVSHEGDVPASPPGEQVRTLPPDPGGAWWIMVSFGCLGAAKAGQYARGAHHLHIPDWYHTGGPSQVGRSVRFELTQLSDLCLVPLLLTNLDSQFPRLPFHREATPLSHGHVLCAIPRGPPSLPW
jgi:hypothetical protein